MTIAVVSLMVKKLPVVKREKTAEKQWDAGDWTKREFSFPGIEATAMAIDMPCRKP